MTVQAKAPVPDVDLDAAHATFTTIFQEYAPRISAFIATRVDREQLHLVDDFTQETFILLWTSYVQQGRMTDVGRPFGLLATIARTVIAKHYRTKNRTQLERTLDFSDPANTPVLATHHVYVSESPDLYQQCQELDAAMARMTEASKDWREKDKLRGRLRRSLQNDRHWQGGMLADTRQRAQADAEAAERSEREALDVFRNACRTVATLRADLERAAGPNWRSSTGMPASAWKKAPSDAWTTDPDRTHCPRGHALDRDTVVFTAEGARTCTRCKADAARPKTKKAPAGRRTVPLEVVERARELLVDPDNRRSIRSVADELGLSEATLYHRIPNLSELRAQAYGTRALARAGR